MPFLAIQQQTAVPVIGHHNRCSSNCPGLQQPNTTNNCKEKIQRANWPTRMFGKDRKPSLEYGRILAKFQQLNKKYTIMALHVLLKKKNKRKNILMSGILWKQISSVMYVCVQCVRIK